MKIKLVTTNTLPDSKTKFWQIVFFPTVSLFRNYYELDGGHAALNFEWLFWSLTLLIEFNDERTVYTLEDL